MARRNSVIWRNAETIGNPGGGVGVTTVILSFNGEDFLPAAIDSALRQETDRKHEIWIHDDASTDGSPGLIRDYVRRNPQKVFGILQRGNLWSTGVRLRHEIYKEVPSEYIASLDGDDYWTDVNKLALQCKRLDQRPQATFSAHGWRRISAVGEVIDTIRLPGRYRRGIGFQSFLVANPVCSATVVVRAKALRAMAPFPGERPTSHDWEMWGKLASLGDVDICPGVMADFRFYLSQTAQVTPIAQLHDAPYVRSLVGANAEAADVWRARFALMSLSSIDRIPGGHARTRRFLEGVSKFLIEASAGNVALARR